MFKALAVPARLVVEVIGVSGLGKPRSRFGEWLDENGIKQQKLSVFSGVSEDTITRVSSDDSYMPSWRTKRNLIRALRTYFDSEVSAEDFWI